MNILSTLYLAQAQSPFGTVAAPAGTQVDTGRFLGWGLQAFYFVLMGMVLVYGLLGALYWVMAGGDEKKIGDARAQITNAAIGAVVGVGVLILWIVLVYITGNPFIKQTNQGITICLPSINGPAC